MHLTIASVVRNEADAFLASALEAWKQFADHIIVLDDGSTDATPDILKDAGVELHTQSSSMLGNEWPTRVKLWNLVKDQDWVVWCDADHVPSSNPKPHLKGAVSAFKVFDLWSETEYREDAWWTGHKRHWWSSVRMTALPKDFTGRWNERGVHSGHVPRNLPPAHPVEDCFMLHYGYSTPELRAQKMKMYEEGWGPHLTPQEKFHAKTILTKNPLTKPLPFEVTWPLHTATP